MATNQHFLSRLGVRQAGEPAMGITEFQWPNGLRLVLQEDRSRPVVEVLVVYRVGSRNEGLGVTGIAHLLEHMMFKGTERFNSDRGNSLDILLAPIGASTNANTWLDRTIYHELVPSNYLELVLKLEADRMRNLRLRQVDLDSEMTVVRNELEQRANYPQMAMREALYATAFQAHPYRHDTIGWVSDVENMPISALGEFYNLHYWPNNATVVISGDFASDDAIRLVHKYFGKIPASPEELPKVWTVEPKQRGERRFSLGVAGNVRMLAVAFHTPNSVHEDAHALALMARLLGSSHQPDSRLYQRLFDTGMVSSLWTSCDELKDPGLFTVQCDVAPGVDMQQVEAAILDEIARMASEPASEDDLRRLKIANRKGTVLTRADAARMAFTIGDAEAHSTWRWLAEYDDKFDAVTADDVMRVARTYFAASNRTVGTLVPEAAQTTAEAHDDGDGAREAVSGVAVKKEGQGKRKARRTARKPSTPVEKLPVTRTDFASRVTRVVLENGVTVLALPFRGTGAAAVNVYLKTGNYLEPADATNLSDVVAEMLPMGSQSYDKVQLARQLQLLGVSHSLHPWVRPASTQVGEMVPSEDVPQLLALLGDIVRRPRFRGADLDSVKLKWRGRYHHQMNSPGSLAQNGLTRLMYEPGHAYFQAPLEALIEQLDRMTPQALSAFHATTYVPAATIVAVVGDIDPESTVQHVAAAFGDWEGGSPIALPNEPAPLLPPRTVRVPMLDKSSVDIVIGHPANIAFADGDYAAFQLGNAVFGGDTMLGRLGKVLRVEKGLTYGAYSHCWDSYRGSPWTIGLSVNPANVDRAVELTRSIWREFLATGVTQEELDREVGRKIGTFQLRLARFYGVASMLCQYEAQGVDIAEIDEYALKTSAVTVDEVNAAMRRHLHPEHGSLGLAGTFTS